MEPHNTLNNQSNLEKEEKARGTTLLDFKLYYKVIVVKSSILLGYKQTHRSMEENTELRNKPTHGSVNL